MFSWVEIGLEGGGAFIIDSIQPLPEEHTAAVPIGFILSCSADKLSRTDGPFKKSDPFFEIKHTPGKEFFQQVILYLKFVFLMIPRNTKEELPELNCTTLYFQS
jgi:hypothetical protein